MNSPHPLALADEAPPDRCRNCGVSLQTTEPLPRHCPACGQETRLHPPTFGEFVHEFVGHYVALEGALWRTLGLLLFRPGRLTLAYLQGRRRRYVLPLRVYISASFLFFLIVKVFGLGVDGALQVQPAVQTDGATQQQLQACLDGRRECEAIERWVAQLEERLRAEPGGPQALNQRIQSQLVSLAPYAMFAMQPVFAALMALAWRRRQQTYGAHFVFSLHLHAFWFLAFILMAALPAGLSEWVLPLIAVYTLWAMRTVYGGRWGPTLARGLFIGLSYLTLLMLLLVGYTLAVAAG